LVNVSTASSSIAMHQAWPDEDRFVIYSEVLYMGSVCIPSKGNDEYASEEWQKGSFQSEGLRSICRDCGSRIKQPCFLCSILFTQYLCLDVPASLGQLIYHDDSLLDFDIPFCISVLIPKFLWNAP
jgi:hypothetical protein